MDAPAQPVAEGSVGSSPVAKKASENVQADSRARVGTKYQMRSEIPAIPNADNIAFAMNAVSDKSAGNHGLTVALREAGHVGYFRRRRECADSTLAVEINIDNYFEGILETLTAVLNRLFNLKVQVDQMSIMNLVDSTARTLAYGCCTMTYLKLRYIVTSEFPDNYTASRIRKPRADEQLPLPTGFAFAIQQLGIVNVVDLPTEIRLAPIFPDLGHTRGIPADEVRNWNPNAYATAVEYARSLGMKFNILDITQKEGTAWWLLRQVFDEDMFELHCPLPETNFTKSMAITHSLWMRSDYNAEAVDPDEVLREPFDLAPIGQRDYGSLLREPHHGINVSSYEAISEEAPAIVDII